MSEIERGRGVALWSQIGDILADDILKGRLPQGQMLPSAQELATRFDVNRHTVRRAMATLEQRNLVRTEQGRGTFVQEQALDYPISRRTRFNQNMRNLNVDTDTEILEDARELPPTQVAEALGLGRNEYVYRIETMSRADGHIVDHSTAYFPAARFPGLPAIYRRTQSVTQTLNEFGITDYVRKHTRVSARLPDAHTARLMKQPANRPILHVQSINADPRGMPVQYGITRFSGDWVQLVLMAGD
ncbi:phosphonate metabolism transcriptional regulator PhnF [Rhodanobacter sp. MP7CTX1]|jgi:GntR family transcriptional regulator, phosphonate transport system regulatory protein|uniref:phosphonate metabolism transcriptional regulator PhnF n=1 Tax=Rhodanobacter sp. MP7CTX1 TaxID=2723084 RepID=UPI00160C7B47|nr:phosphonate metabolism transcriptional regulator PhnF [Rhodanobacter sp. MP7CTX1]MBB6187654.1 GntR family phosphonate transport system transcriptional regulator [Rhodanobacter sp. MP7CTX1]